MTNRASMSKEPREILKDSSFFPSNETEIPISEVFVYPAKKIRANTSQERPEITHASSVLPSKETEMDISGVTVSPTKKREQKYRSLDSEETEMSIPVSPAKKIRTNMSQEPRKPSKKTEFHLFGVSIPLSSAYSTISNEGLKKKTNYLDDPKKVLVSTTLSIYDDTWPCGNPDDTNVTCAPRNEQLTEQTRRITEMIEDMEQYETGPWIEKVLEPMDMQGQLSLYRDDVKSNILEYLSQDDQNKLLKGQGITIEVYDYVTQTKHEVFLKKRISKKDFILKNSWHQDFVLRRGLQVGDEIGLAWDRFCYNLHFRVLYRATAIAPTKELKLFPQSYYSSPGETDRQTKMGLNIDQ